MAEEFWEGHPFLLGLLLSPREQCTVNPETRDSVMDLHHCFSALDQMVMTRAQTRKSVVFMGRLAPVGRM
ncbi:MAG: hypothetical protein ABW184_09925 [Sphingobium sp.]